MIAAPGFVHGQWSVFLLGVLVLALFVYRRIESRSARQVRLGSSPINGLRWRTATICIAVLLMALSALRPFGGFEEVELRAAGRDIVAVVDVSNSMLAADVSPSRLSLVRRKLHDVLRLTLESGRRDRLGIIVFAGSAQLFCPLTADYTVLKSFINAISPELVVQGGSDLDSALDGAATIIEGLSASDPLVLVFSDGGDEPLDTDMLRRRFRDSTIPIVVFGVGTAEGGKIELEPGRLLTDWNGRVVVSRLAEDNLKAAAEAAGGRYFRARPDDGDLRSAFATASEDMPGGRTVEQQAASVRVYEEFGPIIIGAVLVLLLGVALMGRWQYLFPGLVLLAASPWCASALVAQNAWAENVWPSSARHARAGQAAYDAGDFSAAEQHFGEALQEAGAAPRLLQGLGSAQFKRGKYEEAAKTFAEMAEHAETIEQRFDALYNKGNAELAERRLDQAISSYSEALQLRNDSRAVHNLEVARRLKSATPPPQNSNSKSSGSDSSAASSLQENNSDDSNSSQGEQSNSSSASMGEQEASSVSEQGSSSAGEQGLSSASEQTSSPEDGSSGDGQNHSTPVPTPSERSSAERSSSAGEENSQPASMSSGAGASGSSNSDLAQQPLPNHDPKALKEQEAKSWLEALPDNPMLPRGDPRWPQEQGEHTW